MRDIAKCIGKQEKLCIKCAHRFEHEQNESENTGYLEVQIKNNECRNFAPIGYFSPLRVELIDHIANNGQGEWKLLAPLRYANYKGESYEVPAYFVTDFASVPRAPGAYLVAGCRGHAPSVLHDYLCRSSIIPRRQADDIFYEALRATGVPPAVASMMHIAVRSYSDSLDRPKGWEDEH